jgi:hypothetical protein
MVAIHNRALTPSQIQQNFDAGVGEKYFMLFNVSHLVSVPQAYVMLEAQQLDSYGLQFAKPTFISLDPNASVANLQISGVHIGVNGGVLHAGQAYAPLDEMIGGSNYTAGAGQQMTPIGTVVSIETTVYDDLYFLQFDHIGTNSNPLPDPPTPTPATPTDLPAESDVGLRTFDELNASLSLITGVSQNNAAVVSTYTLVKQALPSVEKLGTFGPAQQTGFAQLAIQYCSQMVENPTLRTAFFGGSLNPSATATATFGSTGSPNVANRDIVIDALMTKGKNTGLEWDSTVDGMIPTELDDLIDKLVAGPTGGASGGTGTVMKAACGAVLGSGTTLIQ